MSDEKAFQQAETDIGNVLRGIIPTRIDGMATQPESPIERMFLIGLMSFAYVIPIYDFADSQSRLIIRSDEFPTVRVELQAPVEGYRADFLLTIMHKGSVIGKVVIECDGHDFHERTKDQAARDRSRDRTMTLAGYKVMRFTGSELYRDLMQCVSDAHYAAWHFYLAPEKQ